jgi:GAF domain-containing protein
MFGSASEGMNITRFMLQSVGKACGLREQRVYYSLVLAFGLFFILPSLGFINFMYKYKFIEDRYIPFFFLCVLVFSYVGFFILRTIADQIRLISERIEQSVSGSRSLAERTQRSELDRIVASFQHLLNRLEEKDQRLEEKVGHLRLLIDLSDTVASPAKARGLLERGLEKALTGTGACGGSVLLLDESRRNHLTVTCVVGSRSLGSWEVGTQIPLRESAIQEAVLQRRPLFLNTLDQQDGLSKGQKDQVQNCGAMLFMPLFTERDVVAVFHLEGKRENALFSLADLEFMLPLASFLAYRHENSQLQELTVVQMEQFNCLSSLIKTCNLGLRWGKVFHLVVDELRRSIPLNVCFIGLIEDKQEFLQILEADSHEPVSLHGGMRLSMRQSLFRVAFEEQQPIQATDLAGKLHPMEAKWFQELGVRSCYLVPFKMQGLSGGILFAGSQGKDGFSGPQQIILQQVSEHLGVVVHNLMLLERLEGQSRKLEVLDRLSAVLSSFLFNLDETLHRVGSLLDQVMGAEAGAIYLREGDVLVAKRTFGPQAHQIKPLKVPLAKGIFGYVTSKRESVLIKDISQNPHMGALLTGYGKGEIRSLLCVPIIAGEQVEGVMHLWNKQCESFCSHDEKVMKSVAANLAIAVAAARLHKVSSRFLVRLQK